MFSYIKRLSEAQETKAKIHLAASGIREAVNTNQGGVANGVDKPTSWAALQIVLLPIGTGEELGPSVADEVERKRRHGDGDESCNSSPV